MSSSEKNSFFEETQVENLNRYSHFAPRMDWIRQFFEFKDDFFERNNLGYVMLRFFKRFLLDTDLLEPKSLGYSHEKFSNTAKLIEQLGLNNKTAWSIMMVNLCNNSPLVSWYVKRVIFNESYSRLCLQKMIDDYGSKGSPDAVSALGQMCCLPLSDVGFGKATYDKNSDTYNRKKLICITRTKWEDPAELVILYSLYKFAEASGWFYGFKIEKLFDDSERGVSPVKIFGVSEKKLISILSGLSVNYPDFISATFTLNIKSVTLNPAMTSKQVLDLIGSKGAP